MAAEEQERNILEYSLLHRLMVGFHAPVRWPAWLVIAAGALLASSVAAVWGRLSRRRDALAVAAFHFFFFVADTFLLWQLPRREISFGPWKAQALVLAVPRALAVVALAPLARVRYAPAWALTALAQVAGSLLLYWGAVVEPLRLALTHVELELDSLPAGARPIRLLHISDLHVERLTRREARVLELARAAKPDIILITGDYVNLSYNADPQTHRQVRQFLAQLEAPGGVYATLGSPPVDLRDAIPPLFDDLPVTLLRDDCAVTHVDGQPVALLGLDCTHHLGPDAACLASLAARTPRAMPRILLYHSPELMPQAVGEGLDLYLCGHTHGGQVRLPFLGALITSSQLGRRYVMGHYREGQTHLYVSRGIGLEGLSAPRVRFLSPPEITLITLRPE